MNNWRDIKKEVPKPDTIMIRVKYVYCIAVEPPWSSAFPYPCMWKTPFALTLSQHLGIGIVHIDPPRFDDDGIDLLSAGFRWSDLKGEFQTITHWMYVNEPYDESEETPDVLIPYQDGKVKEPTSVKILEFDKPNKMRRKYDSKNIASIINKDPRFKKENNMEFVKEITVKTFDVSRFEEGAAYLCTPLDYPDQKFIGIFASGDSNTLTFVADNYSQNNIKEISIDDAHNWTIEKMIQPMTDDELNLLCDIFIHLVLSEEVNEIQKDTIRSIQKKLGFTVEE